jgi:hypothetical protein
MPAELVVSRRQIEALLGNQIPEFSELISCMRLSKEGDGFKAWFRQALENLNVRAWARLYEDPTNEVKIALLMLDSPAEVNKTVAEVNAMSPAEQSVWARDFFDDMVTALGEIETEEPFSQAQFDAMPEEEKKRLVADVQRLLTFFMPSMFNLFAKIVHGKSLFQLVAEAKEDEFQSFLDAIQIDKSILTTIPYFVDVNHRAADESNLQVQRQIATYRNKPIFQGNIRYLPLWLVFSILDDMMLLEEYEKDLESFAQLCQNLRVYGPPPDEDVVDLEAFKGRLKDYRQHRRHLIERSMTVRLVKDETLVNLHP